MPGLHLGFHGVFQLGREGNMHGEAIQALTILVKSQSRFRAKPTSIGNSLELTAWQPLTEIPPGNAAISQATVNPAEWAMTRTFSGFYRVKTPP